MSPVEFCGCLEVTVGNGRDYGGEGSAIPIDLVAIKGHLHLLYYPLLSGLG